MAVRITETAYSSGRGIRRLFFIAQDSRASLESIGQYHDHRDVPVRFLLVFFALFAFFVFSALFLLFVLGDDAPDTL